MESLDYHFDISQFTSTPEYCLAWSEDGELAVAGGEYLLILGMS